jgi:hypothetical protein
MVFDQHISLLMVWDNAPRNGDEKIAECFYAGWAPPGENDRSGNVPYTFAAQP